MNQKDPQHATEAGNEFVDRSPQPYTSEFWAFVRIATRTSRDRGFDLLRAHLDQADAALGPNTAEGIIRDVIGREEIDPYTADATKAPDWAGIENRVVGKYGVLGAEKLYGIEMMYFLQKKDWGNFAKYYVRYFNTATTRSEYPMTNISHELFKHVMDASALQAATRVAKYSMSAPYLGRTDPTDIDTYAKLLYKTGRHQEAIEWEAKAMQLGEGADSEIDEDLRKMKSGQPTWQLADIPREPTGPQLLYAERYCADRLQVARDSFLSVFCELDSSWYSSSTFTDHSGVLSRLPLTIQSTEAFAASME